MTEGVTGMMPALKDTNGLSLVEVMIAMVILLFVSLALMQTALVSIEANMKNVLRDEAVAVAEERISRAKALGFDDPLLISDTVALPVLPAANGCQANFTALFPNGRVYVVNPPTGFVPTATIQGRAGLKNVTSFVFCTNMTVANPASASSAGRFKQVDVNVGWSWKGETFRHTATAVIRTES